MLDSKTSTFHERVWRAKEEVGASAPKIVALVMDESFPVTVAAARSEHGAMALFREGVITEVRRILRTETQSDGQTDFSEISEDFAAVVSAIGLNSAAYYVESLGEYVSVSRLISEVALLDDARKYMRRKGAECINEARKLDALYDEVTSRA